MLQIGTRYGDFILDATLLHFWIREQLKPYLEDPTIIKVFFGGDNDFLWMKRDFQINLVGVIDLQQVFQEILKSKRLGHLIDSIQHGPAWAESFFRRRYLGMTGAELETLQLQKSTSKVGFEVFVKLFYPMLKLDKDCQVADFRIREGASFEELLRYARDDVHILLKIYYYLKELVS